MSTIWMSTIPTKHEKLWSTNVIICQLQWVSSHWAHGSALQLLDPLEGLPKMKSPCHTFLCSQLPRCLTMFYFFEATTIISSSKMHGSSTRSSLGKWHQLPALSDPPRPRVAASNAQVWPLGRLGAVFRKWTARCWAFQRVERTTKGWLMLIV